MKTMRYVKIFLVLSIGIWGLLGTIGNLSSLPDIYAEVREVTTMSGVPEGVGPPWRTANPLVVWAGVAVIVLGKIAALIGGGFGSAIMLRHVNDTPANFRYASQLQKVQVAGYRRMRLGFWAAGT